MGPFAQRARQRLETAGTVGVILYEDGACNGVALAVKVDNLGLGKLAGGEVLDDEVEVEWKSLKE
ncbi:hypothetical protein IQ241_00545 [Romeria aff. gracilis LEGE 07310]|uniref:Uncharacterized protein n=1 Tax=Vasconcelosia minhoensis LEGE 07310 TaxID=915328 RepID=A0A8J7DK16_9CYAN|nr:hypothetical protein [Romeria gracilis]MBE9075801.1 hypothetical protein [Romeria aff. gracilis LEGE 07310]